MKKKLFSLLLLLLTATAVSAQTTVPDNTKTLEFLQGDGVYESGVMAFLTGLKESIWTHFDLFITDAKALAAIFMILFFALKSYEMMVGDKKLEIMPLLRPFGLSMIILWWGTFVKVVAFPTDLIAMRTEQIY
ncbi:MAG: plasmid transfer protein, partial [Sphingobacteriales bacterium]